VTGTALLIYNETAYPLDGPFKSREDAEKAAQALVARLKTPIGQAGSAGEPPADKRRRAQSRFSDDGE